MRLSEEAYNSLVAGIGDPSKFALPSVKNKRTSSRNHPEDDLQLACVEWNEHNARRLPLLDWMFHVPNGGYRNKIEAKRFSRMGVKPGVADLILPFPSPGMTYKGLGLELKSQTGRLTRDQQKWLNNAHKHGWMVDVIRDLDHYIEVVTKYMHS